MKRKHQTDFEQAIDRIIAGSGTKTIVAHVTPGGGKSTLPIQASRLIRSGLADKLCWIAPRASLQDQAERNFIDPFFRHLFPHECVIRSSTNEVNPSRGLQGFVTTYQALAVDNGKTVLRDLERYRYILVLDEFHHLADDGEWTEPIRELYERAAFRVLMTGTLARGDEKRIAFVPYLQTEVNECVPDFGGLSASETKGVRGSNLSDGNRKMESAGCDCPSLISRRDTAEKDEYRRMDPTRTALITYTRRDALADQAIIPLEFHFADGVATWRKVSGREVEAKISTGRSDANQALYTALKTEYAEELLQEGVRHWQNHRKVTNGNGSLLVVAASIESAKEYTAILKRQGLHAEIATSDDTPHAVKQIKALKAGKLKILVTVAMAYEGMDCPSISHIVCLTNVRSLPWIEQMVARAVRIDPLAGPYSTQKGFIFAPADRMFVELARQIEADQTEAVARIKEAAIPAGQNGDLFGGGPARPKITPLSSRLIHGAGRFDQSSLFGAGAGPLTATAAMKTQREMETELREEIDNHVKGFARVYNVKIARMNHELKERFGKAREQMTLAELRLLKSYLDGNYEVPQRREPTTVLTPVPWR